MAERPKDGFHMKIYIICLALFSVMLASAFANSNIIERNRFWMTDSYEFGKNGNDCNEIYYNYGTPNWTFSSDDPDLLGLLHKACKAGKNDQEAGNNSLPELLNKLDE